MGALLAEKASPARRGLVYIFTGDGKGKTSAALGVVLRALGHGLKVYIIFFMKGDYPYGERSILSQLPNVDFASFGSREFVDPANIKPEEKEQAMLALAAARDVVMSGSYDLVVLDEVNIALGYNLIDMDEVINLIKDKPPHVELVLTGRYADARLLEMADLVTEMVRVKHSFDKGIKARKGIEY